MAGAQATETGDRSSTPEELSAGTATLQSSLRRRPGGGGLGTVQRKALRLGASQLHARVVPVPPPRRPIIARHLTVRGQKRSGRYRSCWSWWCIIAIWSRGWPGYTETRRPAHAVEQRRHWRTRQSLENVAGCCRCIFVVLEWVDIDTINGPRIAERWPTHSACSTPIRARRVLLRRIKCSEP